MAQLYGNRASRWRSGVGAIPIDGKTVLELGAGAGLPGIVAYQC